MVRFINMLARKFLSSLTVLQNRYGSILQTMFQYIGMEIISALAESRAFI